MLFNDLSAFLVIVIVSGFFKFQGFSLVFFFFFVLFHFVCGALVCLTLTNQR